MSRYRLAPLAKADLDEIWLFVVAVQANIEIADGLIDAITSRFAFLARTPKAGKSRYDVEPGVRSFPVGEYVIYFHWSQAGGLVIARVIHGMRDQRSALGRGKDL